MANLATYSDLSTAIGTWEERTFTSAETDEFILLSEAAANRKLARDWNRQATATLTTDANGLATLPAGFLGLVSIVQDLLGSIPLKQVSWDALIERNPYATADQANEYAIYGTQIRVSPVTTDDFICIFDKKVAALSGSNTTNWLLSLAPDFYLFMGQACACKKFKDYQGAGVLEGMANEILSDLVSQSNVAQYGNAEMNLPMVTP